MKTIGDQQLLKKINRSVLLRALRVKAGLSRADLARKSGLTKSTVSALVRELIDEHWIQEANTPSSLDGLGRPSTPLQLNVKLRVFIGAEIAVECLRVVSVSLLGEVLTKLEIPIDKHQPESICQLTAQSIHALSKQLDTDNLILSGIGICLPGAIDDDSGLVRFAPNLGWREVPFLNMISDQLVQNGTPNIPIYLQNDADAAALGEYEFSDSDGQDPLIFISCDVGVGAGIVLNDRLFTGAIGVAGEIGHTILQVDGLVCSCGRRGCAETFIGSKAIRRAGNTDEAGQYLGVLIQNLDVMFNPRKIILGGKSCVNDAKLNELAIACASSYAKSAGLPQTHVSVARYGLLAAAVGAAALVWHRHLRPIPIGKAVDTTSTKNRS
jgi:predicted NBD/HSP70 family sugar kinase/DNA-binding XRE family transcriptional regulator